MAIDPHGRLGPMFQNFLFQRNIGPVREFTHHPNAGKMHRMATEPPCPLGIVPTACARWRSSEAQRFYGHSHSCPTPREFVQQRLGLAIVKAYGLFLQRAETRTGIKPNGRADHADTETK